ncbi:MAG: energy transducer TonB [Terracidiphilus sp.]
MEATYTPGRTNFGLLPEPEKSTGSFITSTVINGLILALALYVGASAKKIMDQHKYEMTELIIPAKEPPPEKVKLPDPPKVKPPDMPDVKFRAPMIHMPKPEPKPEVKPIQMEAKVNLPAIQAKQQVVTLAPQPKAALTAAMPAQDNSRKPSTKPVHYGQTFGVTPNPYATRPATVAAIGNEYGNSRGPAVAPHGVPGSTGIGNGTKFGSNSGIVGKVASAGIPGATGTAGTGAYSGGKVASTGIPTVTKAVVVQQVIDKPASTSLEVLSKPPVQYTPEARQLKIQGDVIVRITVTASGQVIVQGVVRGLGHGLDEEARRVAQQMRFRPATRNGQPVDTTTTVTITFQLA